MAEKVERRLAAIPSADVVGYSRLMAADDEGACAALTAKPLPMATTSRSQSHRPA